jgi:hypothetical protein
MKRRQQKSRRSVTVRFLSEWENRAYLKNPPKVELILDFIKKCNKCNQTNINTIDEDEMKDDQKQNIS